MTRGELCVSWNTVLVCIREFLVLGEMSWHLWDKCQDQYSWDEREEMQGDMILGQSVCLNFRISCMAAPMECWMVAGGSVLHGVGEVQVHRRSTTICRGQ